MSLYTVRDVRDEDFDAWGDLYRDYALVWKEDISDQRLRAVWDVMHNPVLTAYGKVALDRSLGTLVGFTHFMLYPCMHSLKTVCYIQDLFVTPALRRKGIATLFLKSLAAEGRLNNWKHIHWKTYPTNQASIALYNKIAKSSTYEHFVLDPQSSAL